MIRYSLFNRQSIRLSLNNPSVFYSSPFCGTIGPLHWRGPIPHWRGPIPSNGGDQFSGGEVEKLTSPLRGGSKIFLLATLAVCFLQPQTFTLHDAPDLWAIATRFQTIILNNLR